MTTTITAAAPTKPANPYTQAYKDFLKNTENHRLLVQGDNGLDRRLYVGAPGTGIWAWQVVTWPGYLATVGDVADGYTFSRIEDMIAFFDTGQDYYADGAPSIDFRYWAQKLQGRNGGRDVHEYSSKVFLELVSDTLLEHEELGTEAQTEYENIVEATRQVYALHGRAFDAAEARGPVPDLDIDENSDFQREFYGLTVPEKAPAARRAELLEDARGQAWDAESARGWLREHQSLMGEDAYWEWDLTDFKVHFIYACYAINLTVQLWRKYEASPEAAAHRNPGDSYVVVEGGLVRNAPALPMFDLDVLETDTPDTEAASGALALYEQIIDHPAAAVALIDDLRRLADFVRQHGNSEDVYVIDEHEGHLADTHKKEPRE